jgi:hypothetical protein
MASITKIKGKLIAEAELELSQLTPNTVPVLNASNQVVSSAVTDTELGYVSGLTSDVQTQINSKASATDLSDHINDTVGAHAASAIVVTPAGNLASIEVQAALEELQSDIDGRALDADVIKKDGSVAFTANQSMGSNRLVSLAQPVGDQDAATKAYVDSVAQGLAPKSSVKAATDSALPAVTASGSGIGKTLTADANGILSVDGVSTWTDVDTDGGSTNPVDSVGTRASRVLVKNQVNAVDNGIYHVKDKGTAGTPFILVRSLDTDGSPAAEMDSAFTFVREGTVNADAGYVLTTASPVSVDTDSLSFTQFSGAGSIVAGDALDKVGNTLNVKVDGQGIEISGDQLIIELDGSTLSKSASGLKLSDTAVTPASIGSASESLSITVDQQGRLTSASAQSIGITASQVSDFNEAAQDAVGTILTDTASIDFTYDDSGNTISAAVLPAGVDHDSLSNFVANEHIDHSTVEIQTSANSGLSGGGDITASRSLIVDITGTTALGASADSADEVLIYDVSASALRKVTKSELLGASSTSAGDLAETSFSIANSQATAANITGFAFANGVVRSFEALVSVSVSATASLYEALKITGIQKGSGWDISVIGTGDESLVVFSINAAGQLQYTSATYAGFVSGTIKFRAISTSI